MSTKRRTLDGRTCVATGASWDIGCERTPRHLEGDPLADRIEPGFLAGWRSARSAGEVPAANAGTEW